jgi:hypothetical protein
MRYAAAAPEYPGVCPFCGTEVEQYEDSFAGIDQVCPLCLTDLSVPDHGSPVHPARVRPRRRWARRGV